MKAAPSASVQATWGNTADGGRALTGYGLLFWREGDPHPNYANALVKGAAARSHTYPGLRPGTYRFRIHACNGPDSCGYWTNPPKKVIVPPAPPPTPTPRPPTINPPSGVRDLSFSKDHESFTVRWKEPRSNGGAKITGYGILQWRDGTPRPPYSRASTVSGRSKTYPGLRANTKYWVKVHACNGRDRCGPWTSNTEVTTDPTPRSDPTPPGPVRELRHTGSGTNTVTITWKPPATPGSGALSGYHVQHREHRDDPDTGWPRVAAEVTPGSATTHTLRGLVNGTPYDVRVQACNDDPKAECGTWVMVEEAVPGNPVGRARIEVAKRTIDIGERVQVTVYDIPVGKVAYANLYGAIQPEGRCPNRAAAQAAAAAQRFGNPSTGGWYDAFRVEGCADGGQGYIRVTNADESELYASRTITVRGRPTPVRNLTATVGNGQLAITWDAPTSSGNAALRDYQLQYKAQSSGAWGAAVTVALATDPAYTIAKLTNGTTYDVQVRACNQKTLCGAWTSTNGTPSGTTGEPPSSDTPGEVQSLRVRQVFDGALTVAWLAPLNAAQAQVNRYEVQRKPAGGAWTSSGDTTNTEITLFGLVNGAAYDIQVKACKDMECGDWSASVRGTPNASSGQPPGAALAQPRDLTVTPLPGREAKLTWSRVDGANGYVVEVKAFGEPRPSAPDFRWDYPKRASRDSGKEANESFSISLDRIIQYKVDKPRGLQTYPAFELRVRAVSSRDRRDDDGPASEPIVMIDTPIISVNGHSPDISGATGNVGKAAIKWKDVPAILGDTSYSTGTYSLRFRRSVHASDAKLWLPDRYASDEIEDASSSTGHTISELIRGSIYAIQIIYTSSGRKFFAARDMYVWPSKTPMGSDSVATYEASEWPLIATHDGHFAFFYRVCEATFPSGTSSTIPANDFASSWSTFIEHAFLQWEYATDGLVRMKREAIPCSSDRQPFLDRIVNDVRALIGAGSSDSSTDTHVRSLIRMFKSRGIPVTQGGVTTQLVLDGALNNEDLLASEVIMIQDGNWSMEDKVVARFKQFGEEVGLPYCEAACHQVARAPDDHGNLVQTSDIYLRESVHSDRIRLGSEDKHKRIVFNTCPNTADYYNYPYSSLVHEAGHALGIGIGEGNDDEDHPDNAITDSIMSYDQSVPQCSPHPLDIMIIYAIYQSRTP